MLSVLRGMTYRWTRHGRAIMATHVKGVRHGSCTCKRTGATTTESELHLHWALDATMSEYASLVRRDHGPRDRATLKRVAPNAVRIVTGRNSIRHTMRNALPDMRVLADILDHMPVA